MHRLSPLELTQATGKTRQILDGVGARLGVVPNLFRVLARSPAALEGYSSLSAALGAGRFDPSLREQIALAVAETNLCGYCLSAHAAIGHKAGLTEEQIAAARQASASDASTDAVLKLARAIVVRRGELGDAEVAQARAAGLDEGAIVETVAHVALNIFTNYVNHVARTVVDFPEVKPGDLEAAAAGGASQPGKR